MTAKTEPMNVTAITICLYMALELGSRNWVLAFTGATAAKTRRRRIEAGDLRALADEITTARAKLGVPADAAVRSCYEAGRDGFWVHRELEQMGIENLVIDASSMERARGRRAKTDAIDVQRLLQNLVRHHRGERVWSVCHVPTAQQEDERRNEREIARLKRERSSLVNAIKSGLALHGVRWGKRKLPETFDAVRGPTGRPLPPRMLKELNRAVARLRYIEGDLAAVQSEREQWLEQGGSHRALLLATALMQLKGIGKNFAWTITLELLGWRHFRRTREVGAALGLVPTPFRSDASVDREQGVSKSGSPRLRAMMVEIAWLWLRYQPHSKLTRWFQERFGGSGKRARRIGIVALARKLAIALWNYAEFGLCPEGAVFKQRGPVVDAYRQLLTPAIAA